MKQYYGIKENYKDYILFYRLGDFYEMFFDDAVLASRELEITLTARNCGLEEKAPLCGIPYHAADNYIAKLVERGHKVAICEQVEDPKASKGLVKRDVVRIITPGTVIDPEMLDAKSNNYMMTLHIAEDGIGMAYSDITTGQFRVTEFLGESALDKAIDEILKVSPAELILADSLESERIDQMASANNLLVSRQFDDSFKVTVCKENLERVFKVYSTDALGLSEMQNGIIAAGALIEYVETTSKSELIHFESIDVYHQSNFMLLDKFTRRNLELTETMRSKDKKGSLLGVLDKSKTAMGGRKLRQFIESPLLNVDAINQRLAAVDILVEDLLLRSDLATFLKSIYDFERLSSKIVYNTINPKDMIALKQSIRVLPEIKTLLGGESVEAIQAIYHEIDELMDVYTLLEDAIVDEPPFVLKDGGVIRPHYDPTLHEYVELLQNGKGVLLNIEQREKEATGIKTLKIGYNKVFGYYLDVTKANSHLVPDSYIRKQTLANSERYITEELKELEQKIMVAEEKSVRLETELYQAVKQELSKHIARIKQTANAIATLDVLVSFAEVSYQYGYVRPTVHQGRGLTIVEGRHPVIERMMDGERFIPNDVTLDDQKHRFSIITGPNMAGKSTFLRQTALITLMAQMGCYVPAKEANIGLVDRIFTRVGASDDLAQGQSTFMVEMNELAHILNNATPRSLIILDEIGRGTSTYDGLSIAWAVVEHISSEEKLQSKTLFATHYHELTELEGRLEGVNNYYISVKEIDNDIVFLRKILPGGIHRSFGIEVAKLAGVPKGVIDRAKRILKDLEEHDVNANIKNITKEDKVRVVKEVATHPAIEKLEAIDVNHLTPMEAMNELFKLKELMKES